MNVEELLLVSVGNSRTRAARCFLKERAGTGVSGLQPTVVLVNKELAAAVDHLAELIQTSATPLAIVVASVNRTFTSELLAGVRQRLAAGMPPVYILVAPGSTSVAVTSDGSNLPVPIQTDLTPPITVGVDRLLCALAAQRKGGEASVVIDAGTAVTVDFIDAFGMFRGGVIAPGIGMMLRSLHSGTDALPNLDQPVSLPEGPMGKTTADAMVLGCASAVQGLTHLMIDRYAVANGGYPRVIATGGDAALLFEGDELVEHIVPDLILMGMHLAWQITIGEVE